jgi:hypothetical protein
MTMRGLTAAGHAHLITFAVSDFGGITRGRSITRRE